MKILWIVLNLAAISAAAIIIRIGLSYNKGMENAAPINFSDLAPAEVNYLLKDINYMNRAIVSTILDLYRKGNIEINTYTRESRKKNEPKVFVYEFVLKNSNNLSEHDVLFLNNIFEKKNVVTTDELTQLALNEKEFLTKQSKWVNAIESSLVDKGFYGSGDEKNVRNIRMIGGLIFLIGIVSIINEQYIGLLTILISLGSLLVGINMGMNKSELGRSVHNYYEDVEKSALANNFDNKLGDRELINLIAMGITMKYFLPIYEDHGPSNIISPFTDFINESGGSRMDDAILRGFMGFLQTTRDDSIDTNRVDFRLFK